MTDEQHKPVELVDFLRNKNPAIRLAAAEGIATMSTTLEGQNELKDTHAVRFLVRMIGESDSKIARAVLSSLINFCDHPVFLQQMLSNHVVSRVIDGILDEENKVIELYAILLANVSRDPRGASKVLQVGDALYGYYVTKLIDLFVNKDPVITQQRDDSLGWIASVLNNVTQIEEGRALIMDKTRGLFQKLLPHTEHPNKVRSTGILGVVRNCLFDSVHHSWVLADPIDILSTLCWPIRGPEVYSPETEAQKATLVLSRPSFS